MSELRAHANRMMCLDNPEQIEIRGDYSSGSAKTLQIELRETNFQRRFDATGDQNKDGPVVFTLNDEIERLQSEGEAVLTVEHVEEGESIGEVSHLSGYDEPKGDPQNDQIADLTGGIFLGFEELLSNNDELIEGNESF